VIRWRGEEYRTAVETALVLGVSRQWVYCLAQRGELAATRVRGRIMFSAAAIDALFGPEETAPRMRTESARDREARAAKAELEAVLAGRS
jgi:excisionase family DNA binding protein